MSGAIGGATAAALLGKQPGTPISPAEANPLINRLSMGESPLSSDLPNSLSRAPSGTYDYSGLPQAPFDDAAAGTYGASAFGQGTTGSTALCHPKHKCGDSDRECEYLTLFGFDPILT